MNIRLVRFAALSGYVDVARASGLDPARMMREHGLDPAGLAQPDRRVAADAVIALLEASADASGVDDFGLRLAERRRLSRTAAGSRRYASTMFTQMVSPPTGGVSTQRSTAPIGGLSRQVASQW
ncbi:Probable transcriptional regulatory%2C AraC family [Mycobacteroides abscessus]|nr:Probable transcriptional regulatory%2C AraC family [Mycobacteroides abscessus]